MTRRMELRELEEMLREEFDENKMKEEKQFSYKRCVVEGVIMSRFSPIFNARYYCILSKSWI